MGLLAAFFAAKRETKLLCHDPKGLFNTKEVCERFGASPVQSRTGHLFMKQVMRQYDGIWQ